MSPNRNIFLCMRVVTLSFHVICLQILGDTSASDTHVESVKHSCLTVASRNLTMWEPVGEEGENTTVVPPSDIIDPASCPNECYDRGTCNAGTVSCYSQIENVRKSDHAVCWARCKIPSTYFLFLIQTFFGIQICCVPDQLGMQICRRWVICI